MLARAPADAVVAFSVMWYGTGSEGGEVYIIDAVREVGNSFRSTRVIWRWEGAEFDACAGEVSGTKEIDQASPLRKRTLLDAADIDDVVVAIGPLVRISEFLDMEEEI